MLRYFLLFILLLIIARTFWKVIDGVIEAAGGKPRRGPSRAPSAVRLVRDPVCGTHVAPNRSLSLSAGGTTHYFCSETCRAEYKRR